MKINKTFIFILIILIYTAIFFIIGFYLAKLNYLRTLEQHPILTGIKMINKANGANFTCTCVSNKNGLVTFTFDESNIYNAYFWNS